MKHFLFFTGAPGSRWSAVAIMLSRLSFVNSSDQNSERQFFRSKFSGHRGSYFGPGMELGKEFHRFPELKRADVCAEIDRAFENKNTTDLRIVKSHVFAYNLPSVRETFPESRVMVVWRDNQACSDWWHEIGGFSISYPRYDWYVDSPTMNRRIAEENEGIQRFVEKEGLKLELFDENWIERNFGEKIEFGSDNVDRFKDVYVAVTPR